MSSLVSSTQLSLHTGTRQSDLTPTERWAHSKLFSMMHKRPSGESVTSSSSSRKQMDVYFLSSLKCEVFRLPLIAFDSQSPTEFLKDRTSYSAVSMSTPHLPGSGSYPPSSLVKSVENGEKNRRLLIAVISYGVSPWPRG